MLAAYTPGSPPYTPRMGGRLRGRDEVLFHELDLEID